MIEAKFVTNSNELKKINNIKKQVFGNECDEFNLKNELYVLVYDSTQPVGYGKLIIGNETIIDEIAVIENYRRKYIGDLIVKMLLNKVFKNKNEVYVYSPTSTINFFNSIGFVTVEKIKNKNKMLIRKELIKKQCKK